MFALVMAVAVEESFAASLALLAVDVSSWVVVFTSVPRWKVWEKS